MASPPETLDLSLNEVETLALKAARGAGLPWGLAEDVGRAAVWQARHVGTWARGLLALLEGDPYPTLLAAGFAADGSAANATVCLARVPWPVWLLPALLASPRPLALRLGPARVHGRPGAQATASMPAITIAGLQAVPVVLAFRSTTLPTLPYALQPLFGRSGVTVADWRRLDALAQLTYVPASDHSRRTGAGAGRLDDA